MTATPTQVNLYRTRAHVFQINPETQKSWLSKADQALPVSFVASLADVNDMTNRELKLIAVNPTGQVVLDTVIKLKTVFTKRAPKFIQWVDHTGVLHGLGFGSEEELTEFLTTFQHLQQEYVPHGYTPRSAGSPPREFESIQRQPRPRASDTLSETNGSQRSASGAVSPQQQTQTHSGHRQEDQVSRLNNSSNEQAQVPRQSSQHFATRTNGTNGNAPTTNGGGDAGYQRSQSLHALHQQKLPVDTNNNTNNVTADKASSDVGQESANLNEDWQVKEQLKYENERLKQALEESSKALQESKMRVEGWQRELYDLNNENKELRLRVAALESSNEPSDQNESQKNIETYKVYIDEVKGELKRKDDEIEELHRTIEDMEKRLQDAIQSRQSNEQAVISEQARQKLDIIIAKLTAKVTELPGHLKELSQTIERM